MIGPGWMPSRPRPLPRPRRGPLYWLAYSRSRRRRAAPVATAVRDASGSNRRDDAATACQPGPVLFDGACTKLPIATLLASGSQTRRRTGLDRWVSLRWDWVRPRAVPLLAAFVGLLLTLGAVKYTSLLSYDHDQILQPRVLQPARPVRTAPAASPAPRTSNRLPIYQRVACQGAQRETR